MATTYLEARGSSFAITSTGAVVEGTIKVIGNALYVVALTSVAGSGEEYLGGFRGVYSGVLKQAGITWSKGDRLFYDESDGIQAGAVGVTQPPIAIAWADAASADTSCLIKMWPVGPAGV